LGNPATIFFNFKFNFIKSDFEEETRLGMEHVENPNE